MSKITDKRLSIEGASMRQSLWREKGDSIGDPMFSDEPPKEPTDKVKWVDTHVMIADPLTEVMDPYKLTTALSSNYWSIIQPLESVVQKQAKQLARKKLRDAAKASSTASDPLPVADS